MRARAYLRGPNEKKNGNGDEDAPTSDTRVLEFMKSNYSALAEQVELKWTNGLYLPAPTPSAPEAAAARNAADRLFLELLDKHTREGANVSGNEAAHNFAPRVFARTKEAKLARIERARVRRRPVPAGRGRRSPRRTLRPAVRRNQASREAGVGDLDTPRHPPRHPLFSRPLTRGATPRAPHPSL